MPDALSPHLQFQDTLGAQRTHKSRRLQIPSCVSDLPNALLGSHPKFLLGPGSVIVQAANEEAETHESTFIGVPQMISRFPVQNQTQLIPKPKGNFSKQCCEDGYNGILLSQKKNEILPFAII